MLVLTGCGTAEREAAAQHAADRFVSSLDSAGAGVGNACALLAPDTKKSLENSGQSCEQELPGLALPRGQAKTTAVWADRAQVRTSDDTLFLVELDSGWRVVAAGCRHDTEETYQCALAD